MSIVSISGLDGVGKSTQVALLERNPRVKCSGSLNRYTGKWPKLSPQDHFNWWFKEIPFGEFLKLVIDSLNERNRHASEGFVTVQDRGERMFKAVCVATLLTRDPGVEPEAAHTLVESEFQRGLQYPENPEIFLVRDSKYTSATSFLSASDRNARSSPFTAEQNSTYRAYQIHLESAVARYLYGSGCRVVPVNDCILVVQNVIRAIVAEMTGVAFEPLCSQLEEMIVLSGLSESGKSSFAQALSDHERYCRLKLKYFNGLASRRSSNVTSEAIGHEIVHFLSDHYYLKRVSLESLHGAHLGLHLKSLFGDRCRIVYIDTPENLRIERTARQMGKPVSEVTKEIRHKDLLKLEQGIEQVSLIADVRFSNQGDGFVSAFQSFSTLLRR